MTIIILNCIVFFRNYLACFWIIQIVIKHVVYVQEINPNTRWSTTDVYWVVMGGTQLKKSMNWGKVENQKGINSSQSQISVNVQHWNIDFPSIFVQLFQHQIANKCSTQHKKWVHTRESIEHNLKHEWVKKALQLEFSLQIDLLKKKVLLEQCKIRYLLKVSRKKSRRKHGQQPPKTWIEIGFHQDILNVHHFWIL